MTLKAVSPSTIVSTSIALPAVDAVQERLNTLRDSNPALDAMTALTGGVSAVSPERLSAHVDRYGLSALTDAAIDKVIKVTAPFEYRLLSIFTGLGYSEAQLAARGIDVVGFDRCVSPDRWLPTIHSGPTPDSIAQHADRPLFVSFPDWDKSGDSFAASMLQHYKRSGGRLLIVISDSREHQHAFGCHREFFDAAKTGECVTRMELPAWPTLETLVVGRRAPVDFQPTLWVYRFHGAS
jgi:hypothetical protein